MPIIKQSGIIKGQSNFFLLFGKKEIGLTKAFAYILANNRFLLFNFLREIGIKVRNTKGNFKNVEIVIEEASENGRPDIRISLKNKFYVIVEAKVQSNKITRQATQYIPIIEKDPAPQKYMCLISQMNEHNILKSNKVKFKSMNWVDVDELVNDTLKHMRQLHRFEEEIKLTDFFQLYLRRF